MRPIPFVLRLVSLSAIVVLCDHNYNIDHHSDDPYENPNLQQAVNDFIQTWQHRHHQNVNYQFSITRLGHEMVNAPSPAANPAVKRRGTLMSALTAEDLPAEFRNSGNIISSIINGNGNGNVIPEYLRPQIPPKSGPPPTVRTEPYLCPSCNVSRETDKQLRIAMIQQQILKRLGLKEPPKVNVSEADLANLIPLHSMLDRPYQTIYQEYGYDGHDEFEFDLGEEDKATVSKLISFGEPLPLERRLNNREVSNQSCYFNFAEDHTRSRILQAKLWIYLRPARMTVSNATRIDIYKLGPPMYADGPLSGFNVLSQRIQPKREGGWEFFDVRSVVKEWIRRPSTAYGLQIEAVDNEGTDLPVMVPKNDFERNYKPVIELRFTDNRRRQKRRSDDHCDENQNITRCCVYPLTVDFAQMGWHFILNPRTYKANYCSGECPSVYKQNFQHTHVVQQAYAAKKPCCAPKTMKAVSFLYYYSNGNIVYGKVPDMSVESCTCV